MILSDESAYEIIPPAQKKFIQGNRSDIISNLELDDDRLISELQSNDIISGGLAEKIRKLTLDDEKNTQLLNFMLKQSKGTLDSFIDVLKNNRQPHVARLFELQVDKTKGIF